MRSGTFIYQVVTILLLVGSQHAARRRSKGISDIKERLLLNTEGVSPFMDSGVGVNVKVQIMIYSLDSFNEASMDYYMTFFLRQFWHDQRLAFDNETYPGPLQLDAKDIDRIWVPDLYFINEKNGWFHDVTIPNKLFHIYKNGSVIYGIRLTLKLICNMNLRKYPLDVQKCPIVMESYSQTVENVIFTWVSGSMLPVKEHNYLQPSQFQLKHVKTSNCSSQYDVSYNFSCISAELTLVRDTSYYIIQIYLPSLLVVLLSWVSFWLHPEATPARISLGVLTILTLSTQASGIRPTLPKVGYIKALDVWMAICMTFLFAALLEFAVVNMLTRGESLFMDLRGKVKASKSKDKKESVTCDREQPEECDILLDTTEVKRARLERAGNVDNYSRIIFPFAFFLFNLFYWIYYTV